MMRTKILFSDLDGTLLDDDKNVSAEDLESINEMIAGGHRFVIATGRPLYSAKVVAKELGLYRDGVVLAASNGGVIFDCRSDKVISRSCLDLDTVSALFDAAIFEGLSVHTYTEDNVVSTIETKAIDIYTARIKMPYKRIAKIPDDLPAPPPKLIVMSINEGSRQILEGFEKRHEKMVEGRAQSVFSNDFLLEYLPVGVSKGNAVRTVCALFGISIEDSVAAGDEANDIPMLDAAGVGAVMKNGTNEAKAHADYVTVRTNNESGISEIIRKFIKVL